MRNVACWLRIKRSAENKPPLMSREMSKFHECLFLLEQSFHVGVFDNLVFTVFIASTITCEGFQCQKNTNVKKVIILKKMCIFTQNSPVLNKKIISIKDQVFFVIRFYF